GRWRFLCGRRLVVGWRAGTVAKRSVHDPDVIAPIDVRADRRAEHPVVTHGFRPRWIPLEDWNLDRLRLVLCRDRRPDANRAQGDQRGRQQMLLMHSPIPLLGGGDPPAPRTHVDAAGARLLADIMALVEASDTLVRRK